MTCNRRAGDENRRDRAGRCGRRRAGRMRECCGGTTGRQDCCGQVGSVLTGDCQCREPVGRTWRRVRVEYSRVELACGGGACGPSGLSPWTACSTAAGYRDALDRRAARVPSFLVNPLSCRVVPFGEPPVRPGVSRTRPERLRGPPSLSGRRLRYPLLARSEDLRAGSFVREGWCGQCTALKVPVEVKDRFSMAGVADGSRHNQDGALAPQPTAVS